MTQEAKKPAPINLLLIDDEQEFVNVLSKRLAKRNILTTKAYSGKEGIHALRDHHFDVAVLDLKMGDINGIEVLKILKIIDPLMPVIMLTGHGSRRAAQEGLEAGAFDYLTKPYDLHELVEKIFSATRRKDPASS
ncbi:MAG: response regulator [Desulfatiglandales bacterium]